MTTLAWSRHACMQIFCAVYGADEIAGALFFLPVGLGENVQQMWSHASVSSSLISSSSAHTIV